MSKSGTKLHTKILARLRDLLKEGCAMPEGSADQSAVASEFVGIASVLYGAQIPGSHRPLLKVLKNGQANFAAHVSADEIIAARTYIESLRARKKRAGRKTKLQTRQETGEGRKPAGSVY